VINELVLVLGASSKVGRELIKELSGRGYKLILHCFKHCSELKDLIKSSESLRSAVVGVIKYDFRESRTDEFIKEVLNYVRSSKLSAVIALSAIYDETPETELTDELVNDIFKVNLLTYIVMIPKLINLVKDGGVVILFSDAIACKDRDVYVGLRPSIPYIISKVGVIALVKFLSKRIKGRRIIAVAPSWIETNALSNELKLMAIESTPIRKLVKLEEVVELIINLIKDMKGVSGVVFELSGGI